MMKNTIYSIAIVLGIYSQEMEAEEKQPNIVFIMADDLGWTDLGVMGSDYYETPNIDRLASQGMLFTNAYASAANLSDDRNVHAASWHFYGKSFCQGRQNKT